MLSARQPDCGLQGSAHAFHTVPKLPVPSFSSRVYATDGSARLVELDDGDGMMRCVRDYEWRDGAVANGQSMI